MDWADRDTLEDPTTRTLEGDREITVLEMVMGVPPADRLEPSMTSPEGVDTTVLPAIIRTSEAGV